MMAKRKALFCDEVKKQARFVKEDLSKVPNDLIKEIGTYLTNPFSLKVCCKNFYKSITYDKKTFKKNLICMLCDDSYYFEYILYFWMNKLYLRYVPYVIKRMLKYEKLDYRMKAISKVLMYIDYKKWYTTNIKSLVKFVDELFVESGKKEVYYLAFNLDFDHNYPESAVRTYVEHVFDFIHLGDMPYNENYFISFFDMGIRFDVIKKIIQDNVDVLHRVDKLEERDKFIENYFPALSCGFSTQEKHNFIDRFLNGDSKLGDYLMENVAHTTQEIKKMLYEDSIYEHRVPNDKEPKKTKEIYQLILERAIEHDLFLADMILKYKRHNLNIYLDFGLHGKCLEFHVGHLTRMINKNPTLAKRFDEEGLDNLFKDSKENIKVYEQVAALHKMYYFGPPAD